MIPGLLLPQLNLEQFPWGWAILPELSLLVFAIAVILLDLFTQSKRLLAPVSVIGIALSAFFSLTLWGVSLSFFSGMLTVDAYALFFKLLFLGTAVLVILASIRYATNFARFRGEYYALVLMATLGMILMAATAELVSIYIALELTSISLYALSGFLKDPKSSEASLKYLLLGAIASAILLYGMALVFGFTGETQLIAIAQDLQRMSLTDILDSPGLALGIVLMIAGFGFKIAAVPFHMWVPDVYEGAPTPVTAFLSVGSKGAGFAVVLRVFYSAFGLPELAFSWGWVFAVLAALGMTLGNLAALPQSNIKRLLGYSSIAQAGYIMVGLATVGFSASMDVLGRSGILFFLVSYALSNLGAFIAVIGISNQTNSDLIQDYAGMGKRSPLVALALTLCLISLIGIPPTAGFIAKFYLFSGAVSHGLLWLIIIAVLNSVISAYYYLRIVKVMWFSPPDVEGRLSFSPALAFALTISCLGVLALGLIPAQTIALAQTAARMLGF